MSLSNWFKELVGHFGNNPDIAAVSNASIQWQRSTSAANALRPLSEGVYVDALRLNYISTKQYYQYMAELGFSKAQAKLLYFQSKSRLTPIELSTKRIANSYQKIFESNPLDPIGDIKETNLDKIKAVYRREMYKIGYDKDKADKMFETLRPVPTFSIILEWLAKEAFEPDVINQFGLLKDLPDVFVDLMRAIGVPDGEIQRYWIAHWNHPAPGQIGEMYQLTKPSRGVHDQSIINEAGRVARQKAIDDDITDIDELNRIEKKAKRDAEGGDRNPALLDELGVDNWSDIEVSDDDFTEALKLHEFPEYWRNRIIARSFNRLPFSMLQTMYAYALKPDDWFIGRLRDYGYTLGDAQSIMDVWRRKFPYSSKNPLEGIADPPESMNYILTPNLFKNLELGLMTETEVKQALLDRGLPEADIRYFVQKAKDKYLFKHEHDKIKAIQDLHRKAPLTEANLRQQVERHVKNPNTVNDIVEIIKTNMEGAFVRYNIRIIGRGITNKTISDSEARAFLEDIRVHDPDIAELIKIFKKVELPDDLEGGSDDE